MLGLFDNMSELLNYLVIRQDFCGLKQHKNLDPS